ncbi:MAG: potassium-transporting ATPase subunit KdpC [Planctomycetota bacterium]
MFRRALIMFTLLTVLVGVVYPIAVWGLAQALFPFQANGSVLKKEGRPIGSKLIGQSFWGDGKYFWGRPSATSPFPYNAAASSGSNLGPTNPALREVVAQRVRDLKNADPENKLPVPVDLVTASGSGLDPEISVAGAYYQVPRVSKARGIPAARIEALVAKATSARTVGLLGEPRVNVLELNLALDALK